MDSSVLGGDVRVRESKRSGGWWVSKPKPPVVIIGAGSEVCGRIVIENQDTRLYVHDSARVGAVEGATAQPFQAGPRNDQAPLNGQGTNPASTGLRYRGATLRFTARDP